MENNSSNSLSFFSGFTKSEAQPLTAGHVANPIWLADSAAIFPPYQPVESARMKLKRRLHSRSPLSSIENLPRGSGGPAARVGPMKVGLKEDDVLVMDAVLLDSNRFTHGMEELYNRAIKPVNEVEKSTIGKPPAGAKSYQCTVPVQQKKINQLAREYSVYNSTEEDQEEYITKVLYGPSDKKRLPVFVDICPE